MRRPCAAAAAGRGCETHFGFSRRPTVVTATAYKTVKRPTVISAIKQQPTFSIAALDSDDPVQECNDRSVDTTDTTHRVIHRLELGTGYLNTYEYMYDLSIETCNFVAKFWKVKELIIHVLPEPMESFLALLPAFANLECLTFRFTTPIPEDDFDRRHYKRPSTTEYELECVRHLARHVNAPKVRFMDHNNFALAYINALPPTLIMSMELRLDKIGGVMDRHGLPQLRGRGFSKHVAEKELKRFTGALVAAAERGVRFVRFDWTVIKFNSIRERWLENADAGYTVQQYQQYVSKGQREEVQASGLVLCGGFGRKITSTKPPKLQPGYWECEEYKRQRARDADDDDYDDYDDYDGDGCTLC